MLAITGASILTVPAALNLELLDATIPQPPILTVHAKPSGAG